MFAKNNPEAHNPKESDSSRGQRNSRSFLIGMIVLSVILSLTSLGFALTQNLWSLFLLSGAFAIAFITEVFSVTKVWDAPLPIKLLVTTFVFEFALAIAAGIFSLAYGLPVALIAIVVAFLFAAFNPTGWLNEWIISLGLVGALGGTLLGVLTPYPQVTNLIVNYSILGLAIISVFVLIRLFTSGLIIASLRIKLVMSALAIAITPLVIISIINLQTIQNTIKSQSNESLRIATKLTVNQMDSFFTSNLTSVQTEASLPSILEYLKLDPTLRSGSPEELELQATLQSLQTKETIYTPAYGLLNLLGMDIFDTETAAVGMSELKTDYFQGSSATGSAYASSVEFEPNTRNAYLYFIAPIFDENRTTIGYLRMRYDARILQSELEKTSGIIGAHSYPMLLDENGIRLADTSSPNLIYRSVLPISNDEYTTLLNSGAIPSYIPQSQISSVISEIAASVYASYSQPYEFFTVNLQSSLTGILDSATFGTMTTQPWNVVYLQEQTSLGAAQQTLTRSTTLLAVLIVSLVSILITIMSNLFTRPILQLTQTAETIAAGDLEHLAVVGSKDEIGILGNAFNSMTQQLKGSIENLEKRVRDRTQQLARQNDALQYRSRQLQIVADVARGIVSTTNFESLLTTVTTLISDRFNYYHVGIFLLDDQNEYAVLRASNSPGGQRMLNRQHKLKVGQVGIVGYVTGSGTPRIATDVGKDAVFFNNPDLPGTKSEMALPLKIEDLVIGALDIQSIESNAFSEEEINLFSTLADQISVAINNNQLLTNTEKALEEAQNLHRQYLNQEWTKRSSEIGRTSYKYTSQGLILYEEELPEIRMVLDSGRPVTRAISSGENNSKTHSVLAVPILLRGETIGVIHLQENEEKDFNWSENELVTVQTIADQVAQTLESARLFEQTIRRADRERRVLEITSKIRSTNDPQKMLEVTLEELKRHLGASQAQIVINVPVNPSHIEEDKTNTPRTERRGIE